MASRIDEYLTYHRVSKQIGDIDPAHGMLRYLCDRFELNIEQRYWLAFLYALTYCGPSVFFVYNEFPDFETLNKGRMERWWTSYGREQIICQTDRRWCRSNNQFVDAIESYRKWVGKSTQQQHFLGLTGKAITASERYGRVYENAKSLYTFGQFTLFLYLEALDTITDLHLAPSTLDLDKAWSCRYGLYYAYGMDEAITDTQAPIPTFLQADTIRCWNDLLLRIDDGSNVWNIETTLCAYRKFYRGKRYLGYYLDRQALEIAKMQDKVRNGVAWEVLWQFRQEHVPFLYRVENVADTRRLVKGIPPAWTQMREADTTEALRTGTVNLG